MSDEELKRRIRGQFNIGERVQIHGRGNVHIIVGIQVHEDKHDPHYRLSHGFAYRGENLRHADDEQTRGFQVGDHVIGTSAANTYRLTREGVKLEVTAINPTLGMFAGRIIDVGDNIAWGDEGREYGTLLQKYFRKV